MIVFDAHSNPIFRGKDAGRWLVKTIGEAHTREMHDNGMISITNRETYETAYFLADDNDYGLGR